MIIRTLSISHFGEILDFEETFSMGLHRICHPQGNQISAVLGLVLCYRESAFPKSWLRSDTRISAQVLIRNKPFWVQTDGRQLTATDPAGNDVTKLYQYVLAHCPEQDMIEQFDGRNKQYAQLLYRYRAEENPALSARSNRITDTPSFRRHLWQFIHSFQPEPIHCAKNYQLHLLPDGRFFAALPGYSGQLRLSETEEKLFRYLCFLNIAEFWGQMEEIRNLHPVRKPLLIRNFLEFLDESAEISPLLSRTEALGRQIIMLTRRKEDDHGILFPPGN